MMISPETYYEDNLKGKSAGKSCSEMIDDNDEVSIVQTGEDNYNKLYLKFLKNYSEKQKGQNMVFSPFSVMILFLMLADATDGISREEIMNGICKGIGLDEAKELISMVAYLLEEDCSFCSANAVCVKKEYKDKIKKQYEETLVKTFGGKLFASGDIVKAVNDCVSKNTKGMIKQIVSEMNAEMISCFMNAVAFKASWESKFDDEDIKENIFYNADGSRQKVKMLCGTEYGYVEDERFTGFIKEYDAAYSFMALLPKKKAQEFLYESLNQINFRNLFMAKTDEEVEVRMPEFKFSYEAELSDFCRNQGIETVFSNHADFTPMTDEWLKVESVAHKAVIKVDRNGTEAAAVTYAVMITGCPPDSFKRKRKIVRLNRPFVFAIMHNETELPVFVGIVNNIDGNGLEEE